MLPEFEAALADMKPGDSKSFPLTFPADYHGKDVAGKTAQFTLTVEGRLRARPAGARRGLRARLRRGQRHASRTCAPRSSPT